MKELLAKQFAQRFATNPVFYASSGRINLIGEHTDYNGGFVFPGAIDKYIMAAINVNGTDKVRVYSADLQESAEFGLQEADAPKEQWARYIFGVCREVIKRGFTVKGFDTVFAGNVPLGAGLSSSAALESCFAYALNDLFNENKIDKFELAKIGQSTEHNYCGVNCGIMDQFASVFGKKNCLMRLDCRSLEYEYFPFNPDGYKLVLINSMVKHSLGNEYNERRESCEKAVALMNREFGGVETLRDANYQMLDTVKGDLSDEDYRRAKYVLDEKERVLAVCAALEKNDYETVGKKMYETHWGLSRDYTVSCPELDFLVETAQECGVTGSRVMGGGFGGCTINLVRDTICEKFVSKAKREYARKFGIVPEIYSVTIGDGSRKLQ